MKFVKTLMVLWVASMATIYAGSKVNLNAPAPDDMSAYYSATTQEIETLKKKLVSNGFEILTETTPVEGYKVLAITNDELKATSSWMSVINLSISDKGIRIQNPSYFGAAYLKGYKFGKFKKTLASIQAVLGDLYEVKQKYEFDELEDYHFTFGMPYVDDTIKVAKGNYLKSKVEASKDVLYVLPLPNGNILVGHKLSDATNGFLSTLGQEVNAQVLPYKSMIKDSKAEILNAKYYLAVSLPLLSMGGFMKIADIPGKIEDEITSSYK